MISSLHNGIPGNLTFMEVFMSTGTKKFSNHGYHRFYQEFFGQLTHARTRLLEIGAYNGQSLQSWKRIFPNNSTVFAIAYGSHTVESRPDDNIHVCV